MKNVPLRVKLVAALCLLVAVALAITGVAATTAMHGYLQNRLDGQLRTSASSPEFGRLMHGRAPGEGPIDPDHQEIPSTYYIAMLDPSGNLQQVFAQPSATRAAPKVPRISLTSAQAKPNHPFTVSGTEGTPWRMLVVPLRDGSGSLVVAASLDDIRNTVNRLTILEVVIGAIGLLLLGLIGYFVIRNSLRPLTEVEKTAGAIAAGDLTRRVPDLSPRTEVGRLSRALNAMLHQIETAFTAQRESEAAARTSEERMRRFVADASHELRTPLTSIRGFAELYRQGAVPDEEAVRRAMQRIEDEAARMGLLVDDLLTLARLDEQRPLERVPVDVLTIATDTVHDARAVSKNHTTELEVLPGSAAPVVVGDDARIRQVASNLVNNALIHTPAGTTVTVRVGTKVEEARRWVVLEVADTGPGLATDDAERVFERFYRADPSRTRASGGTGLGLSIVAALVAAHEGNVTVDTKPGVGTTFRVRLPHIDTEVPAVAETAPDAEPVATRG